MLAQILGMDHGQAKNLRAKGGLSALLFALVLTQVPPSHAQTDARSSSCPADDKLSVVIQELAKSKHEAERNRKDQVHLFGILSEDLKRNASLRKAYTLEKRPEGWPLPAWIDLSRPADSWLETSVNPEDPTIPSPEALRPGGFRQLSDLTSAYTRAKPRWSKPAWEKLEVEFSQPSTNASSNLPPTQEQVIRFHRHAALRASYAELYRRQALSLEYYLEAAHQLCEKARNPASHSAQAQNESRERYVELKHEDILSAIKLLTATDSTAVIGWVATKICEDKNPNCPAVVANELAKRIVQEAAEQALDALTPPDRKPASPHKARKAGSAAGAPVKVPVAPLNY